MRRVVTVALVVVVASAWSVARGKPARELVPYEVQPGDSCWSIALVVLGEASRYAEIPYCKDKLPHVIPPGTIIKVPGSSRPQAKVAWLQRDVKAKPPASVDWRRARPKMNLWRLYKVSTGGKSYAGIAFEDLSSLRMRARALLVIYGGSAEAARLSRKRKYSVRVLRGAVRGGLAALDAQKPLRLATPSAEVEVVSREMLLEVDRYQTSRVSVYDGHVGVKAQGAKVKVKRDYGTYVRKGQKPAKPRRLPSAPTWVGPSKRAVLTVSGRKARFSARWNSVKAARRYRFALARTRDFRDKVAVAEVGAGILRFRAQELAPGRYYARVAAVDSVGLEGRASQLLEVFLVALDSSRRLRVGKDGVAEASGLLALSVAAKSAANIELSVDGGAFQRADRPLRLQKVGRHEVRARFAGSAATAAAGMPLRLLPVRGAIKIASRTLRADARHVDVEVVLRDSERRPVALPGLRVTAHPGGAAPLTPVAAGKYRARVALPEGINVQRVHLTVSWLGGDLDRGHVDIARPPRRSKPTPVKRGFRWQPDPTVGLEWARPGPGQPARALRPHDRLGATLTVADAPAAASGERATFLRASVRGELRLADVGFSIDLPYFDADVGEDPRHANELGDVRVGARWVALERGRFALAPALRLTLPTGGFERPRRDLLIEPAALLEYKLGKRVTLSSGQALVIGAKLASDSGAANDTELYYSATYSAAWRVHRIFSVAGELSTVFGLRGVAGRGDDARAVALAGAARLRLGRARISLTGGAGLNGDARDLLGRYAFGALVELGF